MRKEDNHGGLPLPMAGRVGVGPRAYPSFSVRPVSIQYPYGAAPMRPRKRPMAKTMPPPTMTWPTVWASGVFMKR